MLMLTLNYIERRFQPFLSAFGNVWNTSLLTHIITRRRVQMVLNSSLFFWKANMAKRAGILHAHVITVCPLIACIKTYTS